MGEQAYHGAQVCSSTNPRKCQDLGDSILLILGSFILLNVGINVVTLLWRHLKSSLRNIFHHFFPKDKQHSSSSSHPMCVRCSPNTKNLCSRVSSRFYRHPSFQLGHPNHLDSWMPDTNDEKAFRCCWKPSQCGHGGAPMEVPWGLNKEGMVGAGEASQAQNLKSQANVLPKQDMPSQLARTSKPGPVPLCLPQENKTKPSDSAPAQGRPHSSAPTAEQVPLSKTGSPAHPPQDTSCQVQIGNPACISEHNTPQAQVHSSTTEHTPTQIQDYELTSVHRLAQVPGPAPSHASVPTMGHTPGNVTSHSSAPGVSPAHATHAHTHVQVPDPSFVPAAPLTFIPVATTAPAPTPATFPVPTTTPATSVPAPIPVPTPPTPATLNHVLSTGHVVYDGRRIKQNLFQVCPPQNSGFSRKDLGSLGMSQEGQGPVSSDTAAQTSKPSDEDSVKTSVGSILGYLELGNMEWKLSKDAEDNSKSFPYCSFHPCSSEEKSTAPQTSTCPKFLVYSKDIPPSQPCFHSPTSTWNSQCMPPPCTLSLPLAPPRSFAFQHPINHSKSTLNTSASLTASKSPAPQCPHPPQISGVSQPQPTKLHQSLNLTQDSGHPKTPGPSKESTIPRKPGLTTNLGFHKNAGLCKVLVPSQDSELHKNSIINEDLGPPKSSSFTKDAGIFRNPSLTQPSGLHKNIPFPPKSNIQKSPGFTRDPRVYRNLEQNQEPVVYKNHISQKGGLHNHPGPSQDSRSCRSNIQMPLVSRSADSAPQKYLSQDSGVIKSSELSQEFGIHKNSDFSQAFDLHKGPGPVQESGDYKSRCLNQESGPHKNLGLATKAKQRFGFTHNVGICRNPENTQDPNFYKYPEVHQNCDPSKNQVFIQDSGQFKHVGVSQESSLHKDSSLPPDYDHKKPSDLARGTDSVQVLGPPQASKSTESLMKSFVSNEAPQENAEPHVSWMSVPPNQNCSSKSQVVRNDLQTFSEVPVLVELQPSTKQTGSQDWVYHPVNIAPSACQNYRQMSVPPKVNWKPYYPGPGPQLGHVVFDARQRQFGVGRDKCEALFPRRLRQDIASNSAEWEYQCVTRNSDKEGTKMHQE